MKPRRGKLVVPAVIVLALAGAVFVFLSRPPALIVTDAPFAALYGQRRILLRQIRSSLILLRPVKPVMIAEGAGSDVLVFAIEDAGSGWFSRRPYCVLVPQRYAEGARRYGGQFPEVPVVLLTGRTGRAPNGGNVLTFSTDLEQDLYRAGLCAAVFNRESPGDILVFTDQLIQAAELSAGQNAFIRGLREQGNGTNPRFLRDLPEISALSNISCVVLAGAGGDYFDWNLQFPVIFFSWLDPNLSSRQAVVVFDDSPWALAVPAVKMIAENRRASRIPSELLIDSAKIADKDILRQLKKTARASRENSQ
jgi:hypothetical protein